MPVGRYWLSHFNHNEANSVRCRVSVPKVERHKMKTKSFRIYHDIEIEATNKMHRNGIFGISQLKCMINCAKVYDVGKWVSSGIYVTIKKNNSK